MIRKPLKSIATVGLGVCAVGMFCVSRGFAALRREKIHKRAVQPQPLCIPTEEVGNSEEENTDMTWQQRTLRARAADEVNVPNAAP